MRFFFLIILTLLVLAIPERKTPEKVSWESAEMFLESFRGFISKVESGHEQMNDHDWVIANEMYRRHYRDGFPKFQHELSLDEIEEVEALKRNYLQIKTRWNLQNWKYKMEDIWLESFS